MKTWVHISEGRVDEVITLVDDVVPGVDLYTQAFATDMIEVTGLSPVPEVGWTSADGSFSAPAVVIVATPTAAEIKEAARVAVSALVQETARARAYDGAESCASYVASTNATWAAEAHVFVAWRDAVWSSVYATLTAVEAGKEPPPTIEALLAGLPVIVWPSA